MTGVPLQDTRYVETALICTTMYTGKGGVVMPATAAIGVTVLKDDTMEDMLTKTAITGSTTVDGTGEEIITVTAAIGAAGRIT
jgi:hypothetical protein